MSVFGQYLRFVVEADDVGIALHDGVNKPIPFEITIRRDWSIVLNEEDGGRGHMI
jgi:hypothetical protein